MDSPPRTPLQDLEVPIQQRRNSILSAASSRVAESAIDSPLQSPIQYLEAPIPNSNHHLTSPAVAADAAGAGGRSSSAGSPPRSSIRDSENSTPHKSQLISQFQRDEAMFGSPVQSPLADGREGALVSPLQPPPPPPPHDTATKPALVVANRLFRDELGLVTKADGGPGTGTKGAGYASRASLGIERTLVVTRVAVGLRVSAAVLSLVSFSVMFADKTKGWAGDSFDRYKEYWYCVSLNVIVFAYSSFQLYALVHHIIKKQHTIQRPIRYYFDFSMDQILAYLLISASSSAATRNDGWVSMFGSDEFTVMANGSIAMSFLAFVTVALSSLISTYNLFRRSA